MSKIVFVSEGLITEKDLLDRGLIDQIRSFKEYDKDLEFQFVTDDAAARMTGDMRQANLRLEKEGPNWVEHDPSFLEAIRDAEIIIIHYSGAGKAFFNAAEKLKLLCVMRSGVENVDMEAANEHGVIVCASPGRAAEPVADFTVTLMLALMRRLPFNNIAKEGKWRAGAPMGSEGMMKNATVGLVGFGMIAQKVASRLSGFGCRIIAYDPWANKKRAEQMNVTLYDDISKLFAESDYISVHARLTSENQKMINASLFNVMKPTAYFVNTARAGLVDEDDLIEAIRNGKLAGAGLDVFSQEPLPDGHPFLTIDNVIITPHQAGTGGDFIIRSIESPLNEIRHYFLNEKYDFKMNR